MKLLFGQEYPRIHKGDRGHANWPGTGPIGEICRSCASCVVVESRSLRKFHKCVLVKNAWTCGPGSDIRLKDEACSFWTRRGVR